MSSKIVLVQPKTGIYDLAAVRPPDSLLAISAFPYRGGYTIKIIDQRINPRWKDALKKELPEALLVGVTSMTGTQIKYALEVSRFVKEYSDVPVVWGGIHASLLPEQTIQHPAIDFVVKGEGDYALSELIQALEGKRDIDSVKGVYYKRNGEVYHTADRELIKNLDDLADFPYELVDLEKYHSFNITGDPSITLMTSRGCPYGCAFCYNTVYYNRTWRGMSAERVYEMIRKVVNDFGVKNIFFEDDNFCVSIPRFEKIISYILKNNIKITWGLLGARADTLKRMSDRLLASAVEAGCVNVDIGVESASKRILEMIAKDVCIPEIVALNKKLGNYFKRIKYTFFAGIPTETEIELLESVKLAIELCKDNPHAYALFSSYRAYPGTMLYNEALSHGFKKPQTLEGWVGINGISSFLYYPWLERKRKRMIQNFCFSSLFANRNSGYKISSPFFKMLAKLYQPIAKMRFEHNIYQLPVESALWLVFSRFFI